MLPRDSKESYVGSVSDLYESVGGSYGLDASGLRAAGERYGSLNWDTISRMPTPSPDRMERVEKAIYRPAAVAYDAGLGDVPLGKNGFSFVDQSADGLNFARSYMMGSIAGKKEHGLMDMYERKAVDSYLGSLRTSKDFQEAYDVLNGENGYEELFKRVKPYYEHPFRGQGEQKGGATTKMEESSIRDFDTSDPEAEYERIYSKREIPDPPSTPETEWNRIHGVTPPMPPAPPVSKQAEAAAPGAGAPQVRFRGNQRETFNSKLGVWVVDDAPPEAEHPEPSPRPRKGVRGKAKRITNYASTANQQNTSTDGQVEASSSTATLEASQHTQGSTSTASANAEQATNEKEKKNKFDKIDKGIDKNIETSISNAIKNGEDTNTATKEAVTRGEIDRYHQYSERINKKLRKGFMENEVSRAKAANEAGEKFTNGNFFDYASENIDGLLGGAGQETRKRVTGTMNRMRAAREENEKLIAGYDERLQQLGRRKQELYDTTHLSRKQKFSLGLQDTVDAAKTAVRHPMQMMRNFLGRRGSAVGNEIEENLNRSAKRRQAAIDKNVEARYQKEYGAMEKFNKGKRATLMEQNRQINEMTGDAMTLFGTSDRKARYAAKKNMVGSVREQAKATDAAKKSGGHGWKGKAGAVGGLLALGAVLGTMMGNHGEQSNAQLYNPNPQPQYAN